MLLGHGRVAAVASRALTATGREPSGVRHKRSGGGQRDARTAARVARPIDLRALLRIVRRSR